MLRGDLLFRVCTNEMENCSRNLRYGDLDAATIYKSNNLLSDSKVYQPFCINRLLRQLVFNNLRGWQRLVREGVYLGHKVNLMLQKTPGQDALVAVLRVCPSLFTRIPETQSHSYRDASNQFRGSGMQTGGRG